MKAMPILALLGFFLLSGATLALPAPASAPALPSYTVTLTAYNAVPEQTDDDPFTTASGVYSNPEIIAARSRDLAEKLPFGAIIEISGPPASQNNCGYHIVKPIIGYRVVADAMNVRYTNRVDILFNKESTSATFGVCNGMAVRVVGFVDITHPSRIPKTQAELVALVKSNNSIALK